jgi:hypothetical protein
MLSQSVRQLADFFAEPQEGPCGSAGGIRGEVAIMNMLLKIRDPHRQEAIAKADNRHEARGRGNRVQQPHVRDLAA